jgi:isoquinoline 1-oxidoreductase beta subunit
MSELTRRTLLGSGAGLIIGFSLGKIARAAAPGTLKKVSPGAAGKDFGAFIRIGTDDSITLIVQSTELGQGVYTSVPMVLADELDVELTKIKFEAAPADQKKYGRMITGGSSSIRAHYDELRKAGAAAREMLVAAAAETWKVPAGELRAENGTVTHEKTKKRATYGQLAERASRMAPPAEPKLKEKSELKLIGKPTKRIDVPAKVKGEAIFGIDVKLPNMAIARVAHCPVFGGKLKRFDGKDAKKVPGVRDVVEIPTGVAVIADHFWAAKTGVDQLDIEWDEGPLATLSTAGIRTMLAKLVDQGVKVRADGDADALIAKSAKKLDVVYELPYLAHATMEPINATADVRKDRCDIWAPTQAQVMSQSVASQITGLPAEKIFVHTTYAGGGFGRKAQVDFVADAVHLSKALGRPVKAIWAREDDMRGGMYRPTSYNRMLGAVDASGFPVAWVHKIASPSILHFMGPLKDGIDRTSVECAENLPYSIANIHVTYAQPKDLLPISTWFWRSVGASLNAFVTECFLDELAALGGKDPLEVRRKLLDKSPRHLRVVEACAEKAGWGKALPAGHARGIAVASSFGSFVAQCAEVSVDAGKVRVHKVVCAVDSGDVVNPSTVVAQMESGIVYGLSAALYGKIDIEKGRAVQGNFDEYQVLRINEMPEIETHLVHQGDPWGGIGEPGTPPIAPAVANALFALTKKPIRALPIKLG